MLRVGPHTNFVLLCIATVLLVLDLHVRTAGGPVMVGDRGDEKGRKGALAMERGTMEKVTGQPQKPKVTTSATNMTKSAVSSSAMNLTAFRATMEKRSAIVASHCADHISEVTYFSVLKNLIADGRSSVLFCPIFKSASTSMLIALLELQGRWRSNTRLAALPGIKDKVYPKLARLNEELYRTRFMVVRHPLERILSCYRDKFERFNKKFYKNIGKKMIQLFRQPQHGVQLVAQSGETLKALHRRSDASGRGMANYYNNPYGPTFSEFVAYVVSSTPDDEHWGPYHKHCASCSITYNYILKMETLSVEAGFLLQHLNATEAVRAGNWNTHVGSSTTKVSCSYYSQLSSDLFKLLIAKYRIDFALYDYSPDKHLACAHLTLANVTSSDVT